MFVTMTAAVVWGSYKKAGRLVDRWRPAQSPAGDCLIVSSTDSLTLRSENAGKCCQTSTGSAKWPAEGPCNESGGTLSPRLEDGKEPVRVSSVVVAVTVGTALTRFGEAVRVYVVLHTLWCRSVTYMTV